MITSATWKKGVKRDGESNPNAKIDQVSVKDIRDSYSELIAMLSTKYKITNKQVQAIIARKRWKED